MNDADEVTQSTNDDALQSKYAAVKLGYWTDEFLQYFCRSSERKQPEINRGYYARAQAVRNFANRFLVNFGPRAQVSLFLYIRR